MAARAAAAWAVAAATRAWAAGRPRTCRPRRCWAAAGRALAEAEVGPSERRTAGPPSVAAAGTAAAAVAVAALVGGTAAVAAVAC